MINKSFIFILIFLTFIPLFLNAELIDVRLAEKVAHYYANQKWNSLETEDCVLQHSIVNDRPYTYIFTFSKKLKSNTENNLENYVKRISKKNKSEIWDKKFYTIIVGADNTVSPFIARHKGLSDYYFEKYRTEQLIENKTLDFKKSYYLLPIKFGFLYQDNITKNSHLYIDGKRYEAIKPNKNIIKDTLLLKNIEEWQKIKKAENNLKNYFESKYKNKDKDTGYVNGVPYYNQDLFGTNTCGPVATAQTLAIYDYFYENLFDYGNSNYAENSRGVTEAIEDLKVTLNWSSTSGTDAINVSSGAEEFTNNSNYSNNLNFDFDRKPLVFWNFITDPIDNDVPILCGIFGSFLDVNDSLHNMDHYCTIVGYDENYGSIGKIITVHLNDGNNWNTDFDINYSSISDLDVWHIYPDGIDNTNPNCSTTSQNNGGNYSGTILVTADGSDVDPYNSGIWDYEFQYQYDGGGWNQIDNLPYPYIASAYFNTIDAGIVYSDDVIVRTRCKDNWGNWSSWDECNQPFTVDNQGPQPTSIAVDVSLDPSSTSPYSTVTVSGSAIYDTGDPVNAGTVEISTSEDSWTASLNSNGNYERDITAPNSSGYVTVEVSDGTLTGNDQAYLTVQGGGSGSNYTYDYSTICEGVGSYPNPPINPTHWISSDKGFVFCWTKLEDIYERVRIKHKWYTPEGSFFDEYEGDWSDDPPSGYYIEWFKTWSYQIVHFDPLSDMEGRHNVKIYVQEWGDDYEYVDSEWWVMSYDFKEHQMCQDVQSNDPWNPINPTNVFYQNDEKAVTWSRYTDVSEAVEVKTVWFEPDGDEYSSDEYTISAPPSGNYYPEKIQWSWMFINNDEPSNKCGQWNIKKYEKDYLGYWDLLYEDSFQILESPDVNPQTTISFSPTSPEEGQDIILSPNATDNTYLQKVIIYWDDGSLNSYEWNDIYSGSFSNTKNIGSFSEGQNVEVYARAFDTSGNQKESSHQIITVLDSDTQGPEVTDINIEEFNGNNNGEIECDELIKISCSITDVSGINDVHFYVDTTEVALNGNYYSICGPFPSGYHGILITATDNDNTPAYTNISQSFSVEGLPAPNNVSISASNSDVILSWDSSYRDLYWYNIYRSENSDTGFVKIDSSNSASYIDDTASNFSSCFYYITTNFLYTNPSKSDINKVKLEPNSNFNNNVFERELTDFTEESNPSDTVGFVQYNCITTSSTNNNFIAIPFDWDLTMASELGNTIGSCNAVGNWDPTIQAWGQQATKIGSMWVGDFEISPGHAYMINVTSDVNHYFVGKAQAHPVFNLVTTNTTNNNFIMLPIHMSQIVNASELGNDIGVCDAVAEWDASSQAWGQQATYIGTVWVGDFPVNVGHPYMVNITSDITWPARVINSEENIIKSQVDNKETKD